MSGILERGRITVCEENGGGSKIIDKKIIFLALVSMLFLVMFPKDFVKLSDVIAATQQKIYMEPRDNIFSADTTDPNYKNVGDTFTVNISTSGWEYPGLFSYEFKLGYDNTMLNATEAVYPSGHFLSGTNFEVPIDINREKGYILFGVTLLGNVPGSTGSGVLATVTFQITKAPEFTSAPGQWDEFWSKGDVNRDGYINEVDVEIIQVNYGWFGVPSENPADINSDGQVDVDDLEICAENYGSDIWTYFKPVSCALDLRDVILLDPDVYEIPPDMYDVEDGYYKYSSLSRQDEILVEYVIVPSNLTTDCVAYKWPEVLHTGDVITSFGPGGDYIIEGDKWFYWINDCPYAMFAHDTRYVLVDKETNETEVIVERWPPMLNGVEMWPTPEEYWNTSYWVYSTTHGSCEESSVSETYHQMSWVKTDIDLAIKETQGPINRSLIIQGHDSSGALKNASELYYDLLLNFSCTEILYLGPEMRENINYICTKENVTKAIENLSNDLTSGDTLWIYIIAHGDVEPDGHTGYIELVDDVTLLYDSELNQSLGQIEEGVNITIVIETCYGGSFMDDLWTLENVKVIITSTDWKSVSYTASKGLDPPEEYKQITDWSWNDTNPQDEGGEFSSGLIEGLDELKEQIINGEITLGELYVQAFKTAIERDAGYRNGDVLESHYGSKKKPNPLLNTVFFPGDINHDGIVNIHDLFIIGKAFGSQPGDSRWNPVADINKDRNVRIHDVYELAKCFGNEYYDS